jgi:hypothetical protein
MPCFYCGKRVSLVRQMSDADFCSDEHRKRYHSLTRLAFGRLLEEPRRSGTTAPRPGVESEPIPPQLKTPAEPAPAHHQRPAERPRKRGHHEPPTPVIPMPPAPKPERVSPAGEAAPASARTTGFRGVFVASPVSDEPVRRADAYATTKADEPRAISFLPEEPGRFAGTASLADPEPDAESEFQTRLPQRPQRIAEPRARRVVVPRLAAQPAIFYEPPQPTRPAAPRIAPGAAGRQVPRATLQRMSGVLIPAAGLREAGPRRQSFAARNQRFGSQPGSTGFVSFRTFAAPGLESSLPAARMPEAVGHFGRSMPGAMKVQAHTRGVPAVPFAGAAAIPVHRFTPVDGLPADVPEATDRLFTRQPGPLTRIFARRGCTPPELRGAPVRRPRLQVRAASRSIGLDRSWLTGPPPAPVRVLSAACAAPRQDFIPAAREFPRGIYTAAGGRTIQLAPIGPSAAGVAVALKHGPKAVGIQEARPGAPAGFPEFRPQAAATRFGPLQSPAHETLPAARRRRVDVQPAAATPFRSGIVVPSGPVPDSPELETASMTATVARRASARPATARAELVAFRTHTAYLPELNAFGGPTAAPARRPSAFGIQSWCDNPLPPSHAFPVRSLGVTPAPIPRHVFVPHAPATDDTECLLPTFEHVPLALGSRRRTLPGWRAEALAMRPPAAMLAAGRLLTTGTPDLAIPGPLTLLPGVVRFASTARACSWWNFPVSETGTGSIQVALAARAELFVSAREALPWSPGVQPELRATAAPAGAPRGISIGFALQPTLLPDIAAVESRIEHPAAETVPDLAGHRPTLAPALRTTASRGFAPPASEQIAHTAPLHVAAGTIAPIRLFLLSTGDFDSSVPAGARTLPFPSRPALNILFRAGNPEPPASLVTARAGKLGLGVPLFLEAPTSAGPRTRSAATVAATSTQTPATAQPIRLVFRNRLCRTEPDTPRPGATDRTSLRTTAAWQAFEDRQAIFASAESPVQSLRPLSAAALEFLSAPDPAIRIGNAFQVVSPAPSDFAVPGVHNPRSVAYVPQLSEGFAVKLTLPDWYEDRRATMPRGRFNPAVRLSNRPSRLPVFRARVEKARMPIGVFSYVEIEDLYDERSAAPDTGYPARPAQPFIPPAEAPAPVSKTLPEAETTEVFAGPYEGAPSSAPACDEARYDPELVFVNPGIQLSGLDFEVIMETYEPRWRSALKTASGLFRGVMLVIPGVIVLSSMLVGCSARGSSLHDTLQSRAAVHVEHNFSAGLDGWYGGRDWAKNWIREPGSGFVRAGQLALYRPSLPLTDYQVEFLGQIENKSIGWVYRAADLQNYYASELVITKHGPSPALALVRYQVVAGQATERVQIPLRFTMHNGRPYRIQQDVTGQGFTTSIEGEVIDFWTDDRLRTGGVGFFGEKGDTPHLYWMKVTYHDDFWGKLCAKIAPNN